MKRGNSSRKDDGMETGERKGYKQERENRRRTGGGDKMIRRGEKEKKEEV